MNNKTALISSNDLYIHGLWWQSHTWSSAKQWCTLMRGRGNKDLTSATTTKKSQQFVGTDELDSRGTLHACRMHASVWGRCQGGARWREDEEERGREGTFQDWTNEWFTIADYNWWQKEKKSNVLCVAVGYSVQYSEQILGKKAINKSFPITAGSPDWYLDSLCSLPQASHRGRQSLSQLNCIVLPPHVVIFQRDQSW